MLTFIVPAREQITIDGEQIHRQALDWNCEADKKLANLWNYFNAFADNQMDENARHSISLYLFDINLSIEKRSKIMEYASWWQKHWLSYAVYKQQIIAGQEPDLETIVLETCPVTIWDICQDKE